MKRRQFSAGAGLGLLMAAGTTPLCAAPSPQRLISIGGALTELVYALGAEASLVGVDSTSLYPPQAQRLPNVGYARTLATEGLLALQAQLIIATEDAGPPAVLRQLEAAGVPLQVLRAEHRFEGLIARTRRLGELLNRRAEAAALCERLERDWQASLRQVAQRSTGPRGSLLTPRVLFILSHGMGQVRIAGQDTAADAMLSYAGARNAVQGVSGYKPLTPEAVIAAAPEHILLTEQGLAAAGGLEALLKLPGLAQTPAGQRRRVLALDALELLGFGPRLPQALSRLAQGLYPEPGRAGAGA